MRPNAVVAVVLASLVLIVVQDVHCQGLIVIVNPLQRMFGAIGISGWDNIQGSNQGRNIAPAGYGENTQGSYGSDYRPSGGYGGYGNQGNNGQDYGGNYGNQGNHGAHVGYEDNGGFRRPGPPNMIISDSGTTTTTTPSTPLL